MAQSNGNELITIDIFEKAPLEAGMHVGDLGCGNLAYFAIPAAKLVGKGGVVYAVDILKSVLDAVTHLVRQEGLDGIIRPIWSNLEVVGATAIPADSLDLAMLHNMLFQSDKDDQVLRETYRLVKRGGRAIIVDWLRTATPFGPPMEDRTDPEQIKRWALEAGFQVAEEFQAGPYHYGLLLTK